MLETILIVVGTSLLTLLLQAFYIRRTIPVILEDVALGVSEQITDQFKEVFESPMTKKAMSILGKKSGESRASDALRNKVADQIMQKSPFLNRILQEFDITPIEGLQLMQDPMIGPFIQKAIQGFTKNLGGPRSTSQHKSRF